MSASYEFWLTDDYGRKIAYLDKYSFASYSRTTQGFGTIQFGTPYDEYFQKVPDIFKPDWRIDVWRSPEENFPMRREGSFLLRKFSIYQRAEDGLRIISLFGRSPLDILRRGGVYLADVSVTEPYFKKTDFADDMMKEVIDEAINIYAAFDPPTGEFFVDGPASLGPVISMDLKNMTLLEAFKEIKADTFTRNSISPSDRKIYFDVVEGETLSNGGFGYIFKTYADLRGADRTGSGLIFSPENGNLASPKYSEDYLDDVTAVSIAYPTPGSADTFFYDERYLSRWNTIWNFREVGPSDNGENVANIIYDRNRGIKEMNCVFLNTPGGVNQPRSLYGVDWDMGDLVRAQFANKSVDAEVKIIYVAVDQDGKETITGRNEIGDQS